MEEVSKRLQAYLHSFNEVKHNLHSFWNFKSLSIFTRQERYGGPLITSECQLIKQQLYYYRLYVQRTKKQNFPTSELVLFISVQARFLTQLKLKNCQISDHSLKLIQEVGWKFIRVARLDDNQITSSGAKTITLFKWQYLEDLKLSKNPIKNKGIELLNKAHFPYLKFLMISECKLTDCCMMALSKNLIGNLCFLDISNNNMGNECFKILIRSNAGRLNTLDLSNDDSNQQNPLIYPIYFSKRRKESRRMVIALSQGMHFSYGSTIHAFFPNSQQIYRHYAQQEED